MQRGVLYLSILVLLLSAKWSTVVGVETGFEIAVIFGVYLARVWATPRGRLALIQPSVPLSTAQSAALVARPRLPITSDVS